MIKGINMPIVIKDIVGGMYITLPQTPPTITYKEGDTKADTVEIVNLGEVEFPNGVGLGEITIDCTFPARYDPSYCVGKTIDRPIIYKNFLSYLKRHKLPVQVICTNGYINETMRIHAFTWTSTGFEGDIDYSVTFREYKKVRPIQIDVTTAIDGTIAVVQSNPPENRTPVATPAATPATYTVIAGDTLCHIGKKLGKDWHDIYDKNKAVIGPNPNKIYVGQVFTL